MAEILTSAKKASAMLVQVCIERSHSLESQHQNKRGIFFPTRILMNLKEYKAAEPIQEI